MKIGLLSFHDAANYGAALQAYALQAYLEEAGHECEYIDYRNTRRRQMYDMGHHIRASLGKGDLAGAVKYLLGTPFMAARKRKFAEFRKAHLKTSAREYRTSAEAAEDEGQYDKIVVGSDQVWGPENSGRDPAFLLDFVKGSERKIAYSSSFGVSEIPEELRGTYAECLKGIGHIAVRERAGCRLVKELTGRDVPLVMDPVFLPGRAHWDRLAGERAGDAPYVFAYTNRGGQFERFLKTTGWRLAGREVHKLSRQTTPGDFLKRGVRVKYSMSPTEFLRNVRDAELVATASFHCLAFAILFQRPFVCFLTGDAGKDERPAGLLAELGLEGRAFHPGMTAEEVDRPIDYEAVNRKLEALVAGSKKYLLDALEGRP